jgi:hypothetical protein
VNDTVTGTTVNKLATLGGNQDVILTATTDVARIAGVVVSGAGTSGSATIAVKGYASCVFDAAITKFDYVTASTTTAGDCHSAGTTTPLGAPVLGIVVSATNGSAGTYTVFFN